MARFFTRTSSEYLQAALTDIGYPMVLVAWFKTTDQSNRMDVLGVGDADGDNTRRIHLNRTAAKIEAYEYGSGGFKGAITSVSFTSGVWSHAACFFISAAERRVYLDGGNNVTNTESTDSAANIDEVNIGKGSGVRRTTDYFEDSIADAAIYDLSAWPGADDGARADAFIAGALPALAAGFSPKHVPLGLVNYWDLIRDEDRDIVGGVALTAFNTPTVSAHAPIILVPPQVYMEPDSGAPSAGDPEALLIGGKLVGGGLLEGRLV